MLVRSFYDLMPSKEVLFSLSLALLLEQLFHRCIAICIDVAQRLDTVLLATSAAERLRSGLGSPFTGPKALRSARGGGSKVYGAGRSAEAGRRRYPPGGSAEVAVWWGRCRNGGGVREKVLAGVVLLLVGCGREMAAAVAINRTEAATLLELRGTLGIRSRYWPRKADACEVWVGIGCDEEGHVITVNLTGLRRTVKGAERPAFAVDALQKLPFLRHFNSSGFALPGSIPEWIGGGALSSLEVLDISAASVSGSLPSSLGSLSQLRSLSASFNNISGIIPPSLGLLSSLSSLSLSQNLLSGDFPLPLLNLHSLSFLSLSSNNLSGSLPPDFFLSFPLAQHISLAQNLFYGQLPPANLSRLSSLNLSQNYFDGSLPDPTAAGASLDGNCFSNVVNQRSLEECEKFYLDRGLDFQGPTASAPGPEAPRGGEKNHLVAILVGAVGGLFLGVVLFVLLLLLCRRKRKKSTGKAASEKAPASGARKKAEQGDGGGGGVVTVNLVCLGEKFSYEELEKATLGFSEEGLIKAGHTGMIYRGVLEGGVAVAVKRIELERVAKKDLYMAELELFNRASHTRLVPLLGHCFDRDAEKLLVYKLMPGRDLAYALHKPTSPLQDSSYPQQQNASASLDWITRLKIAIGAAEGLTYLHHECTPPLVHRDIQASSILLDDKYEVRLGSLSDACVAIGESHPGVLSRILRRSQTSEHGETGGATPTCAYDVFCFGKVLLELVSGQRGLSGAGDRGTEAWIEWALDIIDIDDKESIMKILDPRLLVDEDLLEEVWAMSIVAKSCLDPKPSKRPLARYILKALENPLKVVREDKLNGSGRSKASSHGSWNAAFFGSWRHSSAEATVIPGSLREEYLQKSMLKQYIHGGSKNGGSQGSAGQEEASQRRPGSSEIFPEPLEDSVIQAQHNTNPTSSEKQES